MLSSQIVIQWVFFFVLVVCIMSMMLPGAVEASPFPVPEVWSRNFYNADIFSQEKFANNIFVHICRMYAAIDAV